MFNIENFKVEMSRYSGIFCICSFLKKRFRIKNEFSFAFGSTSLNSFIKMNSEEFEIEKTR